MQPSSLARAFIWATKAVRSPPETSLAMTLAASLALATNRPYSRSMRRTVSPMRRFMVEPLAFWMSLNSWVRLVGMVISAFMSLPLSRKSRAVIILVRLAM